MQYVSPHTRLVQQIIKWQHNKQLEQSDSLLIIQNLSQQYNESIKTQYFDYENGNITQEQFIKFILKEMKIQSHKQIRQPHTYDKNMSSINQYIEDQQHQQQKLADELMHVVDVEMNKYTRQFKSQLQQMVQCLFNFTESRAESNLLGILDVYLKCLYVEKYDILKYDDTLQSFTSMFQGEPQIIRASVFKDEVFLLFTKDLKFNQVQPLPPTCVLQQTHNTYIIKIHNTEGDIFMIMTFDLQKSQLDSLLSYLRTMRVEVDFSHSILNFLKLIEDSNKQSDKTIPIIQQMVQMINIMNKSYVFWIVKEIGQHLSWKNIIFSLGSNETNHVIINTNLTQISFSNFKDSNFLQEQLKDFCLESYNTFILRIDKKKQIVNVWLKHIYTNKRLCLMYFNRDTEIKFMSQKLSLDYRLPYKMNSNIQYEDQISKLLGTEMFDNIQSLVNQGQNIQQDFKQDSHSYHVSVQRSWNGKLKGILLYLSPL